MNAVPVADDGLVAAVRREAVSGLFVVDEDAEDDLESVSLARSSDVLKSRAVRAVDTDGRESSRGNLGNVTGNRRGILALSVVLVWGVGDGPLWS